MKLREALAEHSRLVYPQDWYSGEAFMDAEPDGYNAAHIFAQFLARPTSSVWRQFIWTDDYDSHGNRVYVGGIGQYGCHGFQIHRLLVPDERWVEWRDL